MTVGVVTKPPLEGRRFPSGHVGLGEGRPTRQNLGCLRGGRGAAWLPAVRRVEQRQGHAKQNLPDPSADSGFLPKGRGEHGVVLSGEWLSVSHS